MAPFSRGRYCDRVAHYHEYPTSRIPTSTPIARLHQGRCAPRSPWRYIHDAARHREQDPSNKYTMNGGCASAGRYTPGLRKANWLVRQFP